MSGWRRADLGDVPEVGQEISLVIYRADTQAVQKWARMVAAVVYQRDGVPRIIGPGFSADASQIDWPARPEDITGRAVFWKPYEEERDVSMG